MNSQHLTNHFHITDPKSAQDQLNEGISYCQQDFCEKEAIITLKSVYQFYEQHKDSEPVYYAIAAYYLGFSYAKVSANTHAINYLNVAAQAFKAQYNHAKSTQDDFFTIQTYLIYSYYHLAMSLKAIDQTNEATTKLSSIINIINAVSSNPDLKNYITNMYSLLGEHGLMPITERIDYIKKANTLNPDVTFSITLGILLLESGDYQSATKHLAETIAKTKWDKSNQHLQANALYYWGKCNLHLNRLDQAIIIFNKASNLYKNQNDSHCYMQSVLGLALCYNKTRQSQKSESCFGSLLIYLNQLKSRNSLEIADKMILDLCNAANFPDECHLDEGKAKSFYERVKSILPPSYRTHSFKLA